MKVGKRNIKDGREFEKYFSKPKGNVEVVRKGATLRDTISLMKRVVRETLDDTKEIAERFKGLRAWFACKQIWNFCYSHFQYKKDEDQKEQVRRPARSWQDRREGIDCDCFTVLVGSILHNLGIPFLMRMTRYAGAEFEHIYPVAMTTEGEVIMDCVISRFDYEVPYTQKKDIVMELQYLNGIEGERFNDFGDKVRFEHNLPIDAEDLFLHEMMLKGLYAPEDRQDKKAARKEKREQKKSTDKGEKKGIIKKVLKKGLHVINKIDPGAALFRAGILASMKLNLFRVGSRLRFAYWTPEQAKKNDMDLAKLKELQRIREKVEQVYYGAGGKPEALKEAILKGKGNRNKMVTLNGLGAVISAVEDEDDLRAILGEELFFDEIGGTINGLGTEPASIATSAAVTTASGFMGTIAALVKKIGGIFKKGSQAAQKFQIQDNTDAKEEKDRKFSVLNIFKNVKAKIQARKERKLTEGQEGVEESADSFEEVGDDYLTEDGGASREQEGGDSDTNSTDETTDETAMDVSTESDSSEDRASEDVHDDAESAEEKKGGIMQWIKDHKVATALIALGVVGGAALGIRAYSKSRAKALAGPSEKLEAMSNTASTV